MYVPYAIGVAVFATVWVAMGVLFPELGVGVQITTIALVMLLGSPLFYALSKIIWSNLFFSFDKSRSCEADRTTAGPVQSWSVSGVGGRTLPACSPTPSCSGSSKAWCCVVRCLPVRY